MSTCVVYSRYAAAKRRPAQVSMICITASILPDWVISMSTAQSVIDCLADCPLIDCMPPFNGVQTRARKHVLVGARVALWRVKLIAKPRRWSSAASSK